jgi:putative aldouronate transport system permease protein
MPIFNVQSGGILMAFKHFRLNRSFFAMDWVGTKWFNALINLPEFKQVIRNTIMISLGRLLFVFPFPIFLALLLNDVRNSKFKRISQTIFTFPNFLSWVLVISILRDLFLTNGVINQVITRSGGSAVPFLGTNSIPVNYILLFLTDTWKNAGWSAIIYLATISGIDPSLYEAAIVDGANRWHQVKYITWPGMKPTVVLLLILACGNIMNAGFDQVFNIANPANKNAIDILDTYIYSISFSGQMNQGFAAAASLFKTVINFLILLSINKIAH